MAQPPTSSNLNTSGIVIRWIGIFILFVSLIMGIYSIIAERDKIITIISFVGMLASLPISILQIDKGAFAFMLRGKKIEVPLLGVILLAILLLGSLVWNAYNLLPLSHQPPPARLSLSTPTPSLPTPAPSSPFGQLLVGVSPVITDTLKNNNNGTWVENSTCVFRGGTYHSLNSTPGTLSECYAKALPGSLNTQRIAIQVEMTIQAGTYGGIGFGKVGDTRYFFSVDTAQRYQVFYPHHGWFSCYKGPQAPQPQSGQIQPFCPTQDYIPVEPIRIQMAIQGNTVSFYLNDQLEWTGPNLGISPGTIFFTSGYYQSNADFSFRDLSVWQLS